MNDLSPVRVGQICFELSRRVRFQHLNVDHVRRRNLLQNKR